MDKTKTGNLTLEVGTMLCEDRYIITEIIGAGGFGITYKAYDIFNQMDCAVKELYINNIVFRMSGSSDVIPIDGRRARIFEHSIERFVDEAETLKSINGMKNMVRITDYFRENGTAYFVMQYIDGPTIAQAMSEKGGKFSLDEAADIIVQIGEQLDAIHKQLHILHRDISPENIMLDHGTEPKLIDFGNAKNYMRTAEDGYSVILKPGFAPAEQFTKNGQGPWTDVYSLAAVFYYMATGVKAPPVMDRIHGKPYESMSDLVQKCPDEVSAAVAEALTLKPNDRTQSVKEFTDVLKKYLHENKNKPGKKDDKTKHAAAPGKMPLLTIYEYGIESGKWAIPPDSKIILGRDRKCSNIITGEGFSGMSKQHCIISFDSYEVVFVVKDISTNGTFVKKSRLEKNKEYRFFPGEKICLVNDRFVVEMGLQK